MQKIELVLCIVTVVSLRVHESRLENADLVVVTQGFDTHIL